MFDYCVNDFNPQPEIIQARDLSSDKKNQNFFLRFACSHYFNLPASIEEFRKLHRKKYWYNLKRSQTLFAREHGELNFKIVVEQHELMRYLPEVFRLFRSRWRGKFTSCSWKTADGEKKYTEAMLALAIQNRAFLAVLTDSQDNLLSYGYCLCDNGTVYFYQHSSDDRPEYRRFSLGKVFISLLLERLVLHGQFRKFDFMIGSQPYKLEWAEGCEDVLRLFPKSGGFVGNLLSLGRVCVFFLRQLIARKPFLRATAEKAVLAFGRAKDERSV